MENNPVPDRKELLEGIISEYEKKERAARAEKRKAASRQRSGQLARKMFVRVGVLAILVLALRLVWIVYAETGLAEKPRWAEGVRLKSDYKINECIYMIWRMRSASDYFYMNHGRFPASMDELYGEGLLARDVVCPATGRPYVMGELNGKKVFRCPDPEEHGVKEVWCDVRTGPPVVDRK